MRWWTPSERLLRVKEFRVRLACACLMTAAGAAGAQTADDHGDSREAATLLRIGTPVPGDLGHASDRDYFRVDVTGSGGVVLGSVGPTDTSGELLDGAGGHLASDDRSGPGRNFRIEARLEPGIYYLAVSGEVGSYAVTARLPGERDHGDTASASTRLTVHRDAELARIQPKILVSTAGRIDPAGTDVDVFRMDVARDGTDILVRSAGLAGMEGRLLDDSLEEIASDADVDRPLRIERRLDAGIYYVEVRGSERGSYQLIASSREAACDCACPAPAHRRDHGGRAETATLLPIGAPLAGVIADAEDIDMFRIDVPWDTELRIGTAGPTDTRGELRDATGATLATGDGGGPQGHNFSISANLAAGVYYLAVRGAAGSYAVSANAVAIVDHRDTPELSSLLPLYTDEEAARVRPSTLLSTAGRLVDAEADVFRLDVPEDRTRLTVRIVGYYTSGSLVGASDTEATSDARVRSKCLHPRCFLMETELDAGVHYVAIRAAQHRLDFGPVNYRVLAHGHSRRCLPTARNLVASGGDGEVLLAWTGSADDGGSAILHHEYRQWRQDQARGSWLPIPDSTPGGSNASGLRIAGLRNGVSIFFEVRAVNAAGPGDTSNEAGATPTRIRLSAPETIATGDSSHLGNGGRAGDFSPRPQAADVDGDGDLDLLAVHFDDRRPEPPAKAGNVNFDPSTYIAWYENDGHGTFGEARIVEPNTTWRGVHGPPFRKWSASAVDLDADGDLDLLVNLYDPSTVKPADDDDLQGARDLARGAAWYENEGGGVFSERRPLSRADVPTVADLDGDGDGDLVVLYHQNISWMANEGGGVFAKRGRLEEDNQAQRTFSYYPRAADVDGDGDADVISGPGWFENYGRGGGFASPQGPGIAAHQVADIDGDGDPDVLGKGNWRDRRLEWYENNGASFEYRYLATGRTSSLHAADLDGDGDMEVLSATEAGVVLYENHGDGFSAGELVVDGMVEAVHAADLDGDGNTDVVYGASSGDTVGWLRNTTEPGDSPAATLAVVLPAFLHGTLASPTDVDRYRVATRDGTLTVATNGPTNTVGSLLRFDGTQVAQDDDGGAGTNFKVSAEVEAGAHFIDVRGADGATGPYTLAITLEAADDHGDDAGSATPVAAPWTGWGRLEHSDDRDVFRIEAPEGRMIEADAGDHGLVLMDLQGRTLASAAAGAGLRYAVPRGMPESETTYFIHVVSAGPTPSAYTLTIAYSLAPGTVAFSGRGTTSTSLYDEPSRWHLGDLDGDADLDLVAGFRWGEASEWSPEKAFPDLDSYGVERLADLDGDGDPDLVSSQPIRWQENRGGGAFGPPRVVSGANDAPHGPVQAADVDGDGDLDLMATLRVPADPAAGRSVDIVARWYENQGSGAFSGPRELVRHDREATACDPETCARMYLPADLDGDGHVDLIGSHDRRLVWFRNQPADPGSPAPGETPFSDARAIGDVQLARWQKSRHVADPNSVHVADLDGDGDLDIVAADGTTAWYENEGRGEFSARKTLPRRRHGFTIAAQAADLDGDRDLDVVSVLYRREESDRYSDEWFELVWHENNGGGSYASERHINSFHVGTFEDVRLADVDGDGDADIVARYFASGNYAYTIGWYENLANHGDDHGDTTAEATLAPLLPALLHGVLESPGDRDVFRVASGSGTLRVSSNGLTDTVGALLDAEGHEIAMDDNAGADGNFAITMPVVSGTYYVVVSGIGPRTGPYTLSVAFGR